MLELVQTIVFRNRKQPHRIRHAVLVGGSRLAFILIWFVLVSVSPTRANQDDTPVPSPNANEIARIEQLIAQIEQSESLSPEDKTRIKAAYQDALLKINAVDTHTAAALESERLIEAAPTSLQETNDSFENTPTSPDPNLTAGLELSEVDELLLDKNASLAAQQQSRQELEQLRTSRAARRPDIQPRIDTIDTDIPPLEQELAKTPAPDALPEFVAARRDQLQWGIAALQSERTALDAENRLFNAESELIARRIDLALRRELLLQAEIQELVERQLFLRKSEAERQAQRAEEFEQKFAEHPSLVELAQLLGETAEKRIALSPKLSAADRELRDLDARLEKLQSEFQRTRTRVDNVGTITSIGILLRKQRATIPSVTEIRQQVRNRQQLIRETELELYDASDLREEYSQTDKLAKSLSEQTGVSEQEILELVTLQRDVAGAYHRELDEYFNRLVDLNSTSQTTVDEVREYAVFIDRNILWIRSNQPLWSMDPSSFSQSYQTIRESSDWESLGPAIASKVQSSFVLSMLIAIAIAGLLWQQGKLRTLINSQTALITPVTSTMYRPTVVVLGMTILIASVWPLVLLTLGWLFLSSDSAANSVAGTALCNVAYAYFALELVRQLCRPEGLAAAHFKWPKRVVFLVRRTMRWAMLLILPLSLIHIFARELDDEATHETFQRFSFMALQVLAIMIAITLFRPSNGVFDEHIVKHPDGWISRTKYIWLAILIIIPTTLIGLAVFGYLYTAEQLFRCMEDSLILGVALVIASGLLTRWVLISRRELRLQQFQERQSTTTSELDAAGIESSNTIDLQSINAQSKRLIRSTIVIAGLVGLYLVWARVFPALQALDTVTLWTVSQQGVTDPVPITVKHLLFLIPVVVGTWIAARNAPGLIEIIILQRLPLDSSIRYAITTLAQYVIVTVGIVIFCRTLGFNWGSVQFIIAGLGVGLGFGLQEIVANFVSGIIILFERPIRVGDVVTVGDVTGVVSRIHIRATTIRNWDRKDFVVPNKDLITGRVLNWTLSDSSSRIMFNVGVAYEADSQQARNILEKILASHPLILADPAPMVTFESFDDSSLRFVVRGYVDQLDTRLNTISELHHEILSQFNDAGIGIAFPQLDVHLQTSMEPAAMAAPNPSRSS